MGIIHDIVLAKENGGRAACIAEYKRFAAADQKAAEEYKNSEHKAINISRYEHRHKR